MRMTIGIALTAMVAAVGWLLLPSLMFSKDRPAGEPVVATKANAQAIAERLRFAMTEQEITDEVAALTGAAVVELHRDPYMTTVLALVPGSVVEPRTYACYRFTLREAGIVHEETTGCPATPSS